ncbi:glyoxylase/dioxygenase superfamily protein [Aeromonas phage Gekk3-15]
MLTVPKFQIQQVAIVPTHAQDAIELLSALGLTEWVTDNVTAHGTVFSIPVDVSKANLNFNYQAGGSDPEAQKPLEFEVLEYTQGNNWMQGATRVSHLGMHCTEEELAQYFDFFKERKIQVAQELFTDDHTNPHIAGKRKYHYVIFATFPILGVDLKFIVRHDVK